jgi:hypothetical protein
MHENCPKRIQLAICQKSLKVDVYELGEHNSDIFDTIHHGISERVKVVIEDIIQNSGCLAKRIHVNYFLNNFITNSK